LFPHKIFQYSVVKFHTGHREKLKIQSSANSHRGVGPPYGPEAVLSVVYL
jgi:hypothetical protein